MRSRALACSLVLGILIHRPSLATPGNSTVSTATIGVTYVFTICDKDGISGVTISDVGGIVDFKKMDYHCPQCVTIVFPAIPEAFHQHRIYVWDCETSPHMDYYNDVNGDGEYAPMKRNSSAYHVMAPTPPSGMSANGPGAGSCTVGLETHLSQIPTYPGQRQQALLAEVADSLAADGVLDVVLSPDSLTLTCTSPDNTTMAIFHDDSGLELSQVVTDLKPVDPARCTVPEAIDLVGSTSGLPDPNGLFSVTVRDAAGELLGAVPIFVDLSGCSDLSISAEQPYPGVEADCANRRVRATTGPSGIADITIVGSVLDRDPASTVGSAAIRAGADMTLLNTVGVAAYDQDGVGGLGAGDFSLWLSDFAAALNAQRSDYDHSGFVGVNDFSLMGSRYLAQTSTESGPHCNGQPAVKPTIVAQTGGLNVAWSDCVSGTGTNLATFGCQANTGSQSLVFSMVAPQDITQLTGFQADVVIASANPAAPLPNWWRFDSCRTTGMGVTPSGLATCDDIFMGQGFALGGMTYPAAGPNSARIRVIGAVPLSAAVAVAPGQELKLFSLVINHSKTTGTGACAGCGTPVEIVFDSLKLVQGDATGPADVAIGSQATSNRAYWQQAVVDVEPQSPPVELSLVRAPSDPGELVVEYTLAKPGPGSLELIDVSGRRVQWQSVDGLDQNSHRQTLATRGSLRTGIYFVRLGQAGLSRTEKVIILD